MESKPKNREWVKNAAIVFLVILLILTFFSNTIMNIALEEHRERLHVRIVKQDKGLLDHVPVVDEHKYRYGVERRAALGQADLGEDVPLGRAVDLGGLE